MATLTMTNEVLTRESNLFTDSAGNLGEQGAGNTNRYIPLLYAKKVLYDFYASTVWKEVTNRWFA